ncbi:MAG: hypothetical protein KDG44_11915 [Burkholderiaceae bacterium]|nr:hypothetical protein [Burkholderiaceae bacterium]
MAEVIDRVAGSCQCIRSAASRVCARRVKHAVAKVRASVAKVAAPMKAGNMIADQLQYLAGADSAGIVLGARVPIVLTSRADTVRNRLASAALMNLVAQAQQAVAAPTGG